MHANALIPDRDLFFDLVDEVLVQSGRQGLSPEGPERKIIEVFPDDRVLQIVAGPGSGKTEMLVWRVLFEIMVLGTEADKLMVTTFTEKAATELNVRVVERSDVLVAAARGRGLDLRDPRVHDLRVGTIHSLCAALLTEFDREYMENGTTVVDEVETAAHFHRSLNWVLDSSVRERLLSEEPLAALFRPPWNSEDRGMNRHEQVARLLAIIGQHVETWYPRCAGDGTLNGIEVVHGLKGLTADLEEAQRRWEDYLDQHAILDFATVQKRFMERQGVTRGHLTHIFVDEFQDTNPIQYAIHTRWLDDPNLRLTVVGDDDQSLYRFRGSDIACFSSLDSDCEELSVPYRRELLELNHRSTQAIVKVTERFRKLTTLEQVSLPKSVVPGPKKEQGTAPRLILGPWPDICAFVADEVSATGAGRAVPPGVQLPPEVAFLMFSTSEHSSRSHTAPAATLRGALEERGIRVYNPRNKTAGEKGSPIHDLFALLSYLVDPVIRAPAGKNGRVVEVWASMSDEDKAENAPTAPPPFRVSSDHAAVQKAFRKQHGSIDSPSPDVVPLLDYLDALRERLVRAKQPKLTLAGLVARLLAHEYFRAVGFTRELFREARFTQLLESYVGPTRLSNSSLEQPLNPTSDGEKVVWPGLIWSFLNAFGQMLQKARLDDEEVEAFAQHAVSMLTFHQAKGLQFDRVYVTLTGREAALHSVLRTELFSGRPVNYQVNGGKPTSSDGRLRQMAEADRDREIYVAVTRAETHLTVLADPESTHPLMALHPGLQAVFQRGTTSENGKLTIMEALL